MNTNLSPDLSIRSPLRICLSALAVCAVATAPSSSAQFSIGPNLPPGQTSYAFNVTQDPYAPSENAWFFGTQANPITIAYNSQAGVWEKQLSGAGQLDTFQEVNLLEYVKVGAGTGWTDWHETVATPNFIWGFDPDDTFYTINGGAPQFTGITFGANNTIVNFVFPTDEPAGTVILLHKELQYMGDVTFDNDLTPIVVDEYPTVPEPASLTVLGIGAALAFISRRRES